MGVRPLVPSDVGAARALLKDLTGDIPTADNGHFDTVLSHPGTSILGDFEGGTLCAMATVHVLPNMTFGGRPYALVENVVTAQSLQGHGHGRRVMEAVIAHAWTADCYKIMLLTGHAAKATGFYAKLGFDGAEKQAMTLCRVPTRHAP